ncbi:amino acid deaminase [Niveispirillum sp. KHB5.9]
MLEDMEIDDRFKGIPAGTAPFALRDMGRQGWNLLAGDLPLPAAVLRRSALDANSGWMRAFLAQTGLSLAPHGKTSMCPQLFHRQLADGAWGVTAANIGHATTYRRFGINRILMANQLLSRPDVAWVAAEISRDPDFDFYCLVDSLDGVDLLVRHLRAAAPTRPLNVLLEVGQSGGRTGARSLEDALAVAAAVASVPDLLSLAGIECYEGILPGSDDAAIEARIAELFALMGQVARAVEMKGWFRPGPVLLSAGGSIYYDMAADAMRAIGLSSPVQIVLRSGCYLTHDHGWAQRAWQRLLERSPHLAGLAPAPRPAIELWAYVQSRPDPGRAIVTLGKRDAGTDIDLPMPVAWHRIGGAGPLLLTDHRLIGMNDQHGYLSLPDDSPLRVGDMVCFGISHPCTTFDKWRLLSLVEDDYRVSGGVLTFF